MTMIQTFPAGGGVGVPSGGAKDQALVKNSNTDKDVTWKTITPGHVIEDSAAAATQRDTVQIKGLSVSDDSTNQKTVIEGVGLNSDSLDDITSGSINNIFVQPSMDFTTTERIVGKWINGKPIYQLTMHTGPFSLEKSSIETGWQKLVELPSNINISSLVDARFININGQVGGIDVFRTLQPFAFNYDTIDPGWLDVINPRDTLLSAADAIIYLEYTKTTD